MDLVTLLTVCTLGFDTKPMQGTLPLSRAEASYMGGGYQEQDESRLDEIMTGALTGNLPNPEIKGAEKPSSAPQQKEDDGLDSGPMFFDKEPEKTEDTPEPETKTDDDNPLFFK